ILESHSRTFYEAQAASEFANLIMNELLAVGVHIPERFVIQNSSYPDDSHKRVDIKVDLKEYFSAANMLTSYISENNFIEVKLFGSIGSTIGTAAKTDNIGSILNDILRLEFLTKSVSGITQSVSKYMLIYFDNHPRNYIAYNKRGGSRRKWVEDLLISLNSSADIYKQSEGEIPHIGKMPCLNFSGNLEIDLSDTVDIPNTMFERLKARLKVEISRNVKLQIPFVKYMVFPFAKESQAYFFLIRIFDVKIEKR
ncbi:MAG: hypothetical protein KAJ14_14305, partial [Candidatus Omnitrophica bacterium]|nr:hypothetical protein [Candidatus Omnitrophota bacterium]